MRMNGEGAGLRVESKSWTVVCVVATIYLADWAPTHSYPPASKCKSIKLWVDL